MRGPVVAAAAPGNGPLIPVDAGGIGLTNSLGDLILQQNGSYSFTAFAEGLVAGTVYTDLYTYRAGDGGLTSSTVSIIFSVTGASSGNGADNRLAAGVRAYAVLQGRDFVIPDDVKELALPVLRHRLTMSPGAEIEGLSTDRILRDILDQTPAPR